MLVRSCIASNGIGGGAAVDSSFVEIALSSFEDCTAGAAGGGIAHAGGVKFPINLRGTQFTGSSPQDVFMQEDEGAALVCASSVSGAFKYHHRPPPSSHSNSMLQNRNRKQK